MTATIFYILLAAVALLVYFWIRAEVQRKDMESALHVARGRYESQEATIRGMSRQIDDLQERDRRYRRGYERDDQEYRDSLKTQHGYLLERFNRQKERMKHLQCKNNELTDELFGRSILNQIRFDAFIPEKGWTKTTFKLGRGPCGLTVRALKWDELEDRYILTQQCTNGETKRFEYMKEDVRGRREFREGRTEF